MIAASGVATGRLERRVTPTGCCVVLQGSWRGVCRSNRLAAALPRAKTTEHLAGGFCFSGPDRQGALADGPAWAAPKEHRQGDTPRICRPALIDRLVKHKGHGGTRPCV